MITLPSSPALLARAPKISTVAFHNHQYLRVHGKAPRGTGCWVFCPERMVNTVGYLDHCVTVRGTLTEAKKLAAVHFDQADEGYIAVMP